MKHITLIAFAAGSLATAGIAVLIAAGPEHNHDNKMQDTKTADPAGSMDQDTMMAEMMKLATPNEHHAELAKTIGSWSAQTSFVMDPTQPPAEGTATMIVKPLLDGRFIKSQFTADFMGQPFEGHSIMGYSIAHEQYVSIWIDSMSTHILYMTGNKEDDGSIVLYGTSTSPKGNNPMKIVMTKQDDNNFTDKFYDQLPDGTWNQSGTITYTRE